MDREEKQILVRTLPSRNGVWQFLFYTDKLTDEERVEALARVEGAQAKYQLTILCGIRGPELLISTFETNGTEGKKIPWNIDATDDLGAYQRIRLRIDTRPAFAARLKMRGYGNQGQLEIKAEFENLAHSSRLVFADVFAEDQLR